MAHKCCRFLLKSQVLSSLLPLFSGISGDTDLFFFLTLIISCCISLLIPTHSPALTLAPDHACSPSPISLSSATLVSKCSAKLSNSVSPPPSNPGLCLGTLSLEMPSQAVFSLSSATLISKCSAKLCNSVSPPLLILVLA